MHSRHLAHARSKTHRQGRPGDSWELSFRHTDVLGARPLSPAASPTRAVHTGCGLAVCARGCVGRMEASVCRGKVGGGLPAGCHCHPRCHTGQHQPQHQTRRNDVALRHSGHGLVPGVAYGTPGPPSCLLPSPCYPAGWCFADSPGCQAAAAYGQHTHLPGGRPQTLGGSGPGLCPELFRTSQGLWLTPVGATPWGRWGHRQPS